MTKRGRMRQLLSAVMVAVVAVSVVALPSSSPARADISACTGFITPQSVASNSSTDFTLQITNNDPHNAMRWLMIEVPSGYYTSVNNVTASGWSHGVDGNNYVTLTGGSVSPGSTLVATINATAFGSTSPPVQWNVYISDDQFGNNIGICDGDFTTQITSTPAPPIISNVMVSGLGPTTASIGWQTSTATTGQVAYGLTTGYGKTATASSAAGTHGVSLTGLTPDKTYHYRITANDSHGNSVSTSDSTFVTPPLPDDGSGDPPPGEQPPTTVTPNEAPIKAAPTEKVPPVVKLITAVSAPFKTAPALAGTATDNDAVARIEYSTDGGQNWLPANTVRGVGTKSVSFSFTPAHLDDGNYSVVVRATDVSGNKATTAPVTLVIDRLPPQMGPLVVSFGPEVLVPNDNGLVALVAGSEYKMSASGVGGATTMMIDALRLGQATPATQSFALAQSPDSGLWQGSLSFTAGGTYVLTARSVDGAGNRTSRQLMTVAVSPAGRIAVADGRQALAGARVTLHRLEPSTGSWQMWDGAPYGQSNPQTTGQDGGYSLMAPAGTYYLQVQAPLHGSFISKSFTFNRSTAVAAAISLSRTPHLKLGPLTLNLPDIVLWPRDLPIQGFKAPVTESTKLVDKQLPDFDLPTTDGGRQQAVKLTGKPTLLTVLTTWAPAGQDQLRALAELRPNKDVNVMPVFSQERTQRAATYLQTAGYDLVGIVDADGVLVLQLGVSSTPQHILVDRAGVVKKVLYGVYTKAQLQEALGSI